MTERHPTSDDASSVSLRTINAREIPSWINAPSGLKTLALENLKKEMQEAGWRVEELRVDNVGTEEEKVLLDIGAENHVAVDVLPPPYAEKDNAKNVRVCDRMPAAPRIKAWEAVCILVFVGLLLCFMTSVVGWGVGRRSCGI